MYELALAKVKIRAGAESIETADVVDERADAQVCGYAVPVWLQGLTGFDPDEMEAEVGRKAVTAFYTATLTRRRVDGQRPRPMCRRRPWKDCWAAIRLSWR